MELLSHIVTSFFEDLPHCSPQWLHGFTLPPLAEEACFFPASSPTSVICVLFDAGHSDRCGITSHCGVPCKAPSFPAKLCVWETHLTKNNLAGFAILKVVSGS